MAHELAIRPEVDSDHPAIRTIVSAAFGSDTEAELIDRIRASPEYEPELALVAERDGAIVGHVMVSWATLRARSGDHPILMLSPLAVGAGHQRSGIGGALVRAVADRLAEHGHRCVVLEGDPAYYGRFGFEPASRFGISLPLPDWAPEAAAQLLPLPGFDATATHGGGRVVYPAAFDGVE